MSVSCHVDRLSIRRIEMRIYSVLQSQRFFRSKVDFIPLAV